MMKRQITEWEKIFGTQTNDKELMCEICKEPVAGR